MNNKDEATLDLLRRKRDCLSEILRLITGYDGDMTEESVNSYVLMVDETEAFFNEIKSVDMQLSLHGVIHDDKFRRDATLIEGEIKALASDILGHNKQNRAIVDKVMNGIRGKIKEVNDGRNLNSVYLNIGAGSEGSVYFNRTK